jgi:hypothetical protein
VWAGCVDLLQVEEALRRAKFKFPGRQKVIVSRKWGFTAHDRQDYVQWKKEGRLVDDGSNAKVGVCCLYITLSSIPQVAPRPARPLVSSHVFPAKPCARCPGMSRCSLRRSAKAWSCPMRVARTGMHCAAAERERM